MFSCGEKKNIPNRFYLKDVKIELVAHDPVNKPTRNVVTQYQLNDSSNYIGLRLTFVKEFYLDTSISSPSSVLGYYGTLDTIINFSVLMKVENDIINLTDKFNGIPKITNNFEFLEEKNPKADFYQNISDFVYKYNNNKANMYGSFFEHVVYLWINKNEISNSNELNVIFETKDSLKISKNFKLR